mmetsp:Transcript_57916/g.87297  ORF Transcript_57916/g.87297 Transcript_57916/m.87297 type:complete len:206 (+) Transcript_57916:27-644(+)
MPICTQCQTSDTPCWREGPEGTRTLCNACGIRWKRLMGRTKRPAKRSKSVRPRRNSAISPKERKPTAFGQLGRVARSAASQRPMRSISLPLEDTSALTAKSIMAMSQNELLDCILTRLEELENSQTRTSLQVRVLSNRLVHKTDYDVSKLEEMNSDGETIRTRYEEDFEEDLDVMMKGDGEDEAWLLATMSKGTPLTLLPYESDQ